MQLQILLSLSTAFTALVIVKDAVVAPTHLVLNPEPTDLSNAPISENNGHEHSLRLPPQDHFIWHLNDTSLALEFYKYGAEVDGEALRWCYLSAAVYIDDHILHHGDGPIPIGARLRYTHKTSGFYIQQSPGMNYSTLEHVVSGLQKFHLTYGYFATHFKIHGDANRETGSGEVLLIRRSTFSPAVNTVSPTSGNVSSYVVETPTAPFVFPIPFSSPSLSLNFTAFGHPVPNDDMTQVYALAALYLALALPKYGDIPIPASIFLQWSKGNASLAIEHNPKMTFGNLADVLRGLAAFQAKYGYTEASYEVLRKEKKKETIGGGEIAAVKT